MRNGDGSVTEIKKKDGKSYSPKHWRICISYTVHDTLEDGQVASRRKKVQRNFQGSKTDAKELRDRLIAERDDNGELLSSVQQAAQKAAEEQALTLTRMIEMWDDARHIAGRANERTLKESRRRLHHIESYIGEVPIKDINAPLVEQTYAAIRKDKGLSSTTMRDMHVLLKNVFQKAIDYDLIAKNPCNYVETPRRDDPHRRSLTQEECARLHEAIERAEAEAYRDLGQKEGRRARREATGIARERTFIRGVRELSFIMCTRLGLATGMRRGEILGLTWDNVDLEQQTLRVCQSATADAKIKTPKTEAGIRNVALSTETAEHLATWKERQAEELAKICVEQTGKTPVCCDSLGKVVRADNFDTWWRRWRVEQGFEDLKFHELRHTQATQLLANGVDIKTVQTRMGHASPSITLAWYAHAIPSNDHDAAEMLDGLFSGRAEGVPTDVPTEAEKPLELVTNEGVSATGKSSLSPRNRHGARGTSKTAGMKKGA